MILISAQILNLIWINVNLLKFHVLLQVQNKAVTRLCKERVIVTVNGLYPGPRIDVREGDAVVVHVINKSPYNITIHW